MEQINATIFQLNLGMVNVFLVGDGDDLTLIDTGVAGSADRIFNALVKAGKRPEYIRRILLTHLHPDHSGSAAVIKSRLNIPVFAHFADATLLENGIAVREKTEPSPGLLNRLIYRLFVSKSPKKVRPVHADFYLNDNDILPFGGGIQVLHTPGHSEGHVCFLLGNQGVLIAGDICANLFGLGPSVVYENRTIGLESLHKIARLDFVKAAFGHGQIIHQHASRKIASVFLA